MWGEVGEVHVQLVYTYYACMTYNVMCRHYRTCVRSTCMHEMTCSRQSELYS